MQTRTRNSNRAAAPLAETDVYFQLKEEVKNVLEEGEDNSLFLLLTWGVHVGGTCTNLIEPAEQGEFYMFVLQMWRIDGERHVSPCQINTAQQVASASG